MMSPTTSEPQQEESSGSRCVTWQEQPNDGASLTCLTVLTPPPPEAFQGLPIQLRGLSPKSPAWQCAWSRDGQWLAGCYGAPNACVRIWKHEVTSDSTSQQDTDGKGSWILAATLEGLHERTVRSVAFAPCRPEAPVLASASFDGTVAIWEHNPNSNDNLESVDGGWECTAQLEGHESEVKCVTWNATGSLLATCGRDKSVWIWECFLPGTIGGPDYSSDYGGGDGGEFECLAVLNGHEGDVKCVVFAPSHEQWGDGDEILLSASYDDTIRCWAEDGGDWYCAMTFSTNSSTVWSLATAPGGGRLVAGSDDGSLAIFKNYTASEKARLFPDEAEGSNGLWKCVGKLPAAHSSTVYSVDCAPARAGHGRMTSAGADNCINVYREVLGSSSDQPLFCLDASAESAHGSSDVNCVSWHPWDGTLLASAGDDGTIRLHHYTMV